MVVIQIIGLRAMVAAVKNQYVISIRADIDEHPQGAADDGTENNAFGTSIDGMTYDRAAGASQQQAFKAVSMSGFRRPEGRHNDGQSNNECCQCFHGSSSIAKVESFSLSKSIYLRLSFG